MNEHFRALVCTALCVFALSLDGLASAQDEQNRAGMVIDYGDGTLTYAIVPFEEESISGLDLLERSGVPLVTVDFGGLGQAVCTIGERGCGVGECRQRVCQSADPESPFWKYFRLEDGENWTVLPLGASSAKVEDGSIEGWSWTGTEPDLPVVDLEEIGQLLDLDDSDNGPASPVVQTFDAGGQVLESESSGSSTLSYVAAVAIIAGLVGVAGLLMVRRNRAAGARP
jgi:hypothetical protein